MIVALFTPKTEHLHAQSFHAPKFAVLLLLGVLPAIAYSQSASQFERGIIPLQPYDGNGIGQVNIANGNLALNIPLVSYKQLGNLPDYTLSLVSNNKNWQIAYAPPYNGSSEYYYWVGSGKGVSLAEPTVITAQGTVSCLYPNAYNTNYTACSRDGSGSYGYTYNQMSIHDSSGAMHILAGSNTVDGSGLSVGSFGIADRNGNKYTQWCTASNQTGCMQGHYAITDTHGNAITYYLPYDSTGTASVIEGATYLLDSVGRYIPRFAFGENDWALKPQCYTNQFPAWNDNPAPIQICWQHNTGTSNFHIPWGLNGVEEGSFQYYGISSVTLPDGSQWLFQYDSWGNLQSVTTPAGATETYTWGVVTPGWLPNWGANAPPRVELAVTQRTLTVNGTQSVWKYKYESAIGANDNTTGGVVTVTDPLNNYSVHTLGLNYQFETNVKYYDNHATLLKTVDTAYAYPTQWQIPLSDYWGGVSGIPANNGVTVKSVKTTLPDNHVSLVCTVYDNDLDTACSNPYPAAGNPDSYSTSGPTFSDSANADTDTELAAITGLNGAGNFSQVMDNQTFKYEYDYGSGSPGGMLRETANSYLWQSNSNYFSENLLNLVSQSTVYSGCSTPPCNGMVAQTLNTYDNNAGTGPGDLTSIKYVNNSGASPETHISYTSQGMPSQECAATDPSCSNPTIYTYDQTGLYVQKIQYPTNAANGIQLTKRFIHDPNTGLVILYTDENNVSTQYIYDVLGRPVSIEPGFATSSATQTQYSYPSPTEVDMKQDEVSTGDGAIQTVTYYDQLKRPITTAVISDPSGVDYLDTTYDALGRVHSVSALYRGSDPHNVTTYIYDPLNRMVEAQNSADSTTQWWCYDGFNEYSQPNCVANIGSGTGEWVDFTDESGNHSQRTNDALGRLTKVIEDASASKPETDYLYSPLDNLTRVDQWGGASGNYSNDRIRTFVYNSLSQLTNACNPESIPTGLTCGNSGPWSMTYSYDLNGNVQSTTDARNIRIQYAYDTLNRLQVVTTPDGTPKTPNACFWYDTNSITSSPTGCPAPPSSIAAGTYPLGRMTYEWTSDGLTGTAFSYDNLGHTNGKSVCTPSTCAAGSSYPSYWMAFQFDRAGHQTLESNGFGVSTNVAYDSAGRVSQVTNSLGDANHPNPLWTANSYYAYGLAQATLGNGLMERPQYDNRSRKSADFFIRPDDQAVYYYGVGFYPNGAIQLLNDSVNGNWTYTMDNWNRIHTASATTGPYAGDTIQWTIDPWGNRNAQTLTAGSVPIQQPDFGGSNTNNQIPSFCYDDAGHLQDQVQCSGPGMNHQYIYDALGRMTSPDQGNSTYVYDAEGTRVAKYAGGINWEYLYDLDGNQITEIAPTGDWNRGEVYAGMMHIATYDWGTTFFPLQDWLGNLRYMAQMGTDSEQECANLPFGDGLTCSDWDPTVIQFTGKQRDFETGNDYFGARYYASPMGRFPSPDPSTLDYADPTNPQSLNLYAYVQNNPLVNVDPDGLDCIYTKNLNSTSVTIETVRGDCRSDTDAGVFVNGTVNTDSYKAQVGSDGDVHLSFGYTPDGSEGGSSDSGSAAFQSFSGSTDIGKAVNPDTEISPWAVSFIQQTNQDNQHKIGCIAQAYGVGSVAAGAGGTGKVLSNLSEPIAKSKAAGALGGSSGITSQAAAIARESSLSNYALHWKAPVADATAPFGFVMKRSPNLGVWAGRMAPVAGKTLQGASIAATAYSAYQLGNCY